MRPFQVQGRSAIVHLAGAGRIDTEQPTVSTTHLCNLSRFDLATIELAVLCAETRSLTVAAHLTHMSLSRASHRLRSLEDGLGHRLFHRASRGLVPTSAGEVFATHARQLLLRFNEALFCLDQQPG